MPKSKKNEDTSDSDSGPEDKNPPPPAKKSKADSSVPSKSSKSDSNGSTTNWTLEKLRQVNINEFRGRKMVDIREFYEKDGKTLPGKKGISLSSTQWHRLLEIADEVTAALEKE